MGIAVFVLQLQIVSNQMHQKSTKRVEIVAAVYYSAKQLRMVNPMMIASSQVMMDVVTVKASDLTVVVCAVNAQTN